MKARLRDRLLHVEGVFSVLGMPVSVCCCLHVLFDHFS